MASLDATPSLSPLGDEGAGELHAVSPLVSVVIICFNDAERLPKAVRSALAQSHSNIEVIVVDDHSSDGSDSIATALTAEDSRVRTIRHEVNSGGCGAPRNTGISLAQGQYLFFLDSDDVIPRHAISQLVAAAEQSGAEVTAGGMERKHLRSGRTERWYHWIYDSAQHYESLDERPELVHDTVATNKLYRSTVFSEKQLRFPLGVLYEDVIFTAQLWSLARGIAIIPDVIYHWRVYPDDERSTITNQRTQSRNFLDRIAAVLYARETYRHHSPRVQLEADIKALGHHLKLYLDVAPLMSKRTLDEFIHAAAPVVTTAHTDVAKHLPVDVRLALGLLVQRDPASLLEFLDARAQGVIPGCALETSPGLARWVLPWEPQDQVSPNEVAHDDINRAFMTVTAEESAQVSSACITGVVARGKTLTLLGVLAAPCPRPEEEPRLAIGQVGLSGHRSSSAPLRLVGRTTLGWHWEAALPLLRRTHRFRAHGPTLALRAAGRTGEESATIRVHAVGGLTLRTRARAFLDFPFVKSWYASQETTGPLNFNAELSLLGRVARRLLRDARRLRVAMFRTVRREQAHTE